MTLAPALLPPPQGLAPHAWYFFAIFGVLFIAMLLVVAVPWLALIR